MFGTLRVTRCVAATAIAVFGTAVAASAQGLNQGVAPTGTTILSVDINGGPITTANATTLTGFSPWGGPVSTGGDGTQLPSSQSSPVVNGTSITKTFSTTLGNVTATITASGSNSPAMNSRDRGNPSGPTNDGDLYRDFIGAVQPGSGSNGTGSNPFQITFSGLAASTTYQLTFFAFDSAIATDGATGPGGVMNFSPTLLGTNSGQIQWKTPTSAYSNATTFNATTDGTGALTTFEWATIGGLGLPGQTQIQNWTVLNGFQISTPPTGSAAPEPGSVALMALPFAGGLIARLRRRAKHAKTA